MTHYNRTNPFLYMLDKSNDVLIQETQDLIKTSIIQFILTSLWIIETAVYCVLIKNFNIFSLGCLILAIIMNAFMYHCVRESIGHNKQFYINRKKYPDNDLTTFVTMNNEEMYHDTIDITIQIGRIQGYKKSLLILCVVSLIELIIYGIQIIQIIL